MRYFSLFSGIEAATQAWQPLGWTCVGVSEIEPFPCAVLAHHYPDVPNLGDVTKITEDDIKALGQIDVIVFGSPCQNLSVAGNRTGLSGEQSGLFFEAMRIIQYAKQHSGCRFALWENVPGAFSSNKGADFAAVVEQMAGLNDVDVPKHGWGKEGAAVGEHGLLEWSCLDAQWFGLAQRRKRLFAIVDFGDWQSRPPILLEREGLRGDIAPSREQQQSATNDAYTSSGAKNPVVGALCARDFKGVGNQYVSDGKVILDNGGARRLTPMEFERLQGFGDEYTKIPYQGKTASECPVNVRYKALGNSMAVNVMAWIGRSIQNTIQAA